MNPRRALLLLEVVVGLALLGLLGVFLIRLQADATRQYREATLREDVMRRVQGLLWEWSESGAPVTLPATGQFSDSLEWRREVQPMRVAGGVIATQVTLVVTQRVPHAPTPREIYRVDWLVPRQPKPEARL